MRAILFPIQKILTLFLFVELLLEANKLIFLIVSGTLLILSIILEGARPITPLFFIIIIMQCFEVTLLQAILIAIAGLFIFILRFYHINIPLKGPYNVGHKYLKVQNNGSQIIASIYYPTDKTGKKVQWVYNKSYNKTLYEIFYVDPKTTRIPYQLFKFVVSYVDKIWMPVQGNAPYCQQSNQNKNKLIVFSHGLGAHLNAYTSFCGNWASNGYTVITINHTNDEVCVDYRNCNSEEVSQIRQYLRIKRYSDMVIRINQINTIINQVLDEKLLEKQLGTSFNIQQIILAGHSYGGGTVVAFKSFLRKQLQKNHEKLRLFKKIICFDPWFFPYDDQVFKTLDNQNIMIINSQYFYQDVPQAYQLQRLFCQLKEVTPQLKAYMVEKMDHISQCDQAYIFGNLLQITGTIKYHRYTDYFMALNILLSKQFLNDATKDQLLKMGNQFIKQNNMDIGGVKLHEQYRINRQITLKKL